MSQPNPPSVKPVEAWFVVNDLGVPLLWTCSGTRRDCIAMLESQPWKVYRGLGYRCVKREGAET